MSLSLPPEISVEITKLSSVIYDSQPNYQQEKTVSRTLASTDPTQLQLIEQLLDNLESGDPTDSLPFISKNAKSPVSGQSDKTHLHISAWPLKVPVSVRMYL